jgi:hypothetical protein
MPGIDDMGMANKAHGVCGFTSTLYMVHKHRPGLHKRLDKALGDKKQMRNTRMQAEIKTFLRMMQANGEANMLNDIVELTRTFPNCGKWTIEGYIEDIDKGRDDTAYSIALPPEAVIAYARTMWNLRAYQKDDDVPGDAILGLTRSGIVNRWSNLAHYVYRDGANRLYSWGEQFANLQLASEYKDVNYSVVSRIMLHG